jgi:methionyl-tRNA formyltransferase
MRVGVIGRTGMLLDSAEAVREAGHEIVFVITCKSESFYEKNEFDFSEYANGLKVPFFNSIDLKHIGNEISALRADICISINWLNLIPENFLNIFPLGILNAHAGDLPRYKGNAVANWAILNFEKRIALTIHKMVEKVDSGPYLLKEFLDINEETYISDVYEWLALTIPKKFVEALDVIKTNGLIDQDQSIKTLRTYPRIPSDSKINWACDVEFILAMIRASSHPFDGAFCFVNDTDLKLKIFRASKFHVDFDFSAIPGQICFKFGDLPVVAARNGLIAIEECSISNMNTVDTMKFITNSLRNRLT